jgi:hypothetical protein
MVWFVHGRISGSERFPYSLLGQVRFMDPLTLGFMVIDRTTQVGCYIVCRAVARCGFLYFVEARGSPCEPSK